MSLRDENKEFISYRNEMKWSYIAFVKQIYRTNEVSISSKYLASKLCTSSIITVYKIYYITRLFNNFNCKEKF